MERLPRRLKAVAAKIPPGKVVADIGTDHAMMPLYLVQSGISPRLIATDINKGPFQKAKAVVRLQGLEERIDVRLGNGLTVLTPGEAEVIVICGLGGFTIVDIFNDSPEILESVETLVLSPATHEAEVRKWLKEHAWQIIAEDLVEDQGRLYQIIIAEHGDEPVDEEWTALEYDVGPLIIEEKHPLLKEYLRRKLKKYEKAVGSLQHSQSAQSAGKAKRLLCSIEEIRSLLELLKNSKEESL